MIKSVTKLHHILTLAALLTTSISVVQSKEKSSHRDIAELGNATAQNLIVENRLSLPNIPDVVHGVSMYVNLDTGKVGVSPSSRVYKNTVKGMENLSSKLMQLRPVSFLYNNDKAKRTEYGLIAEEVAEIFPELVVFGQNNKPFSIVYNALTSIMLHALQQQQLQFEEAQQATAAKEEQHLALIASLTERLEQLEQKVAALEQKE